MGTTIRFQDWPSRLESVVRVRERVPFAWGSNDCVLFAADVVNEMTGYDCAASIRGRYRTAIGAKKLIRKHGGLENAVSDHFDPIATPFARRGDVVMLYGPHGPQLGVCTGTQLVAPGALGLIASPISRAVKAWRV